jgi:prepilin-type N-terminal cleavage/methylation domain-containing protein
MRRYELRRAGFTLIELLITLLLSTIVVGLIYTVFISQAQSYRMQADLGTMQQNLRIAMEMVSRDVASAGFGLSATGSAWGHSGEGGDPNEPLYGLRILDGGVGGVDAVEVLMMNPDRSTWARTGGPFGPSCNTQVLGFEEDSLAQAGLYGQGDRILCYNPRGYRGQQVAYIWQVSGAGDSGAGTVPVDDNSGTNDWNPGDGTDNCPGGLPKQMFCSPPLHIAYYVDNSASDNVGMGTADLPVLYLVPDVWATAVAGTGYPSADDIPIALGIEDLELSACLGGQTGAFPDCGDPDNFTTSTVAFSGGGGFTWTDLQAVRIAISARTVRPDYRRPTLSTQQDLDPFDGVQVVAQPDGYHRRMARTVVKLRNSTGAWEMNRAPY